MILGFGSSNPSTRRKIENGSMEIRKKLGAKKAEKSLEISAFLFFSRSDLFRPLHLCEAVNLELVAHFFKKEPDLAPFIYTVPLAMI